MIRCRSIRFHRTPIAREAPTRVDPNGIFANSGHCPVSFSPPVATLSNLVQPRPAPDIDRYIVSISERNGSRMALFRENHDAVVPRVVFVFGDERLK